MCLVNVWTLFIYELFMESINTPKRLTTKVQYRYIHSKIFNFEIYKKELGSIISSVIWFTSKSRWNVSTTQQRIENVSVTFRKKVNIHFLSLIVIYFVTRSWSDRSSNAINWINWLFILFKNTNKLLKLHILITWNRKIELKNYKWRLLNS